MDDEGGKIGEEDESDSGEDRKKGCTECLPCIIMGPQWLEHSDMLSVEH